MLSKIRIYWSFLSALGEGIGNRHIGLIAAGIAFYGLLAIFPAITSLVTLWGFFANPDIVAEQLASYEAVVPEQAYQILSSRVNAIANGPKEVLGWASFLSIGAALWATRAGTAALVGGLGAVYRAPPRGGLRRAAVSLLLTMVLIAVALIAMVAVLVAPVLLSLLPLGRYSGLAFWLLRWLIGIGVVLLGIGLFYRIGPYRPGHRSPLLSPGSILAVCLWAAVSIGFSIYLENFGRYNEIYGSLGAVIAMLMWFYLSAFVVLLGGLVNAELERLEDPGAPAPSSAEPSPADILPPQSPDPYAAEEPRPAAKASTPRPEA
ncbi:YihY/virulence factor BrkB family protein [Tropicimonas sp. IMCC6043]|uniref:YihY/virulence factor BrkB family protein n=1 Tax=Tropicimonas sp. IMCC6043 TaxID=2510645 RepID=UPI00101DC4AB|nr:YihY/virulence factor BrkB family protein [Tropicimonas sp. IMCC6043]RYH11803.1 YihY/virulence factor BrkB family protein [Tropicimonas sp. IMCC6043]